MARFHVVVPFDAVPQEQLDSRVISELPDTELPYGITLRRHGTEYLTAFDISSDTPRTAKIEAIRLVEEFLVVLAAWNCAFQVRIGGVQAQVVEGGQGIAFLESHISAVASRGDLTTESALFERRRELPSYVANGLELNYLLVLSSRSANQWLLAATGLEALAVGAMGSQPKVTDNITPHARRALRSGLRPILADAGLGDLSDRVIERMLGTTQNRVSEHIGAFLTGVGVDIPPEEIETWWRKRSRVAHGETVNLDSGSLQRLVDAFQRALRRTAGVKD